MDCEIRDQEHLMIAEGTDDIKPNKNEIKKYFKTRGFKFKSIEIHYDSFQGFWRWWADIIKEK